MTAQIFFGSSGFCVGKLAVIQKRNQDFEAQIFLVSDTINPALDNPDFVVHYLHKSEGDFVF